MALRKKATKEETPAVEAATPKATAATATAATATAAVAPGKTILHPMLSEKSLAAEAKGVYTFVIEKNATKVDVKNEVKARYGVLPTDVRVINTEGKRKRVGTRQGRRSDVRKAMVTLPKGKTISIHEGV